MTWTTLDERIGEVERDLVDMRTDLAKVVEHVTRNSTQLDEVRARVRETSQQIGSLVEAVEASAEAGTDALEILTRLVPVLEAAEPWLEQVASGGGGLLGRWLGGGKS